MNSLAMLPTKHYFTIPVVCQEHFYSDLEVGVGGIRDDSLQ
jgi:hypothetical protein